MSSAPRSKQDRSNDDVWRAPSRFQFHLRVNGSRLNSQLRTLSGVTLTVSDRWRLLWFSVRCTLRSLGLLAGVLIFFLTAFAILTVIFVLVFRPALDPVTVRVSTQIATGIFIAAVSVWLYFYVGVSAFDPVTGLARAAHETMRHIPEPPETWRPSTGFAFANSTGTTARALFRAVTGRRVNVTLRPDIAAEATRIAETVLVTVPANGSAYWDMHSESTHAYASLLHDVTGLIVIGRTDLAKLAIQEVRRRHSSIFVQTQNPEIATYLHPLGRRTVLDAAVTYLVPMLALAVSALALIVASIKK